ncbi:MAG: DUF4416 family protein [Desulfobacterales bacterium]|jgi:hypothetical protein|nr:DUF4416 family protein [Desulfobacterales bacterium]
MSVPQTPKLAKLIIGIFTKNKKIINHVASELSSRFGQIDLVSSWMDFKYTTYYKPEMGSPLVRRMFAFKRLIEQGELASIKIATNQIEQTCLPGGRRGANIDPGYMLHERFVLASGKNFSHRIYIGLGIYADLTFIYQKGRFQKLPWTYPDYADQAVLTFLGQARSKYVLDVRQIG